MAGRRDTFRVLLFGSVLAVLVTFLAFFLSRRVPDPEFRGRHLSSLLLDPAARSLATRALKELGPRATLLLSNWVVNPEPRLVTMVRDFCVKRGRPYPKLFQERRSIALWALREAPESGKGLIPFFANWVSSGRPALRYTGSVVLADLLPAASGDKAYRKEINDCLALVPDLLKGIGEDPEAAALYVRLAELIVEEVSPAPSAHTKPALEAVVKTPPSRFFPYFKSQALLQRLGADDSFWRDRLNLPRSADARLSAAIHFSNFRAFSDRVIPILIRGLASTNRTVQLASMDALVRYGPLAQAALPELAALLSYPDEELSQEAAHALESMRLSSKPGLAPLAPKVLH